MKSHVIVLGSRHFHDNWPNDQVGITRLRRVAPPWEEDCLPSVAGEGNNVTYCKLGAIFFSCKDSNNDNQLKSLNLPMMDGFTRLTEKTWTALGKKPTLWAVMSTNRNITPYDISQKRVLTVFHIPDKIKEPTTLRDRKIEVFSHK